MIDKICFLARALGACGLRGTYPSRSANVLQRSKQGILKKYTHTRKTREGVGKGSERGKLQSESLFLQLKVQSLIRHQMLTFQRVRVMALWELIHVWLDKRVEHWKPKEEFHQYQLIMGVDDD
ncbi:hypothetical protein YC2023_077192 [Brassica napus]